MISYVIIVLHMGCIEDVLVHRNKGEAEADFKELTHERPSGDPGIPDKEVHLWEVSGTRGNKNQKSVSFGYWPTEENHRSQPPETHEPIPIDREGGGVFVES